MLMQLAAPTCWLTAGSQLALNRGTALRAIFLLLQCKPAYLYPMQRYNTLKNLKTSYMLFGNPLLYLQDNVSPSAKAYSARKADFLQVFSKIYTCLCSFQGDRSRKIHWDQVKKKGGQTYEYGYLYDIHFHNRQLFMHGARDSADVDLKLTATYSYHILL